jgi:Transglycosylase SLT domain
MAGLAMLSIVSASTPVTGGNSALMAAAANVDVRLPLDNQPTSTAWWPAPTVYVVLPVPGPTDHPTAGPTSKPTPKPTPKPYRDTVWNARAYVKAKIGIHQYNCINTIWWHESKWDPRASNPSGAYGIPQAKPGIKMAAFGRNWRWSPLTQVRWGIWYVADRYGSACGALAFWKANGWY